MNSLKLNSSVAAALSKAENELRGILLEAARTVKKDGEDLILHLEDGMKGIVNGFKGVVTIEGQHVGNVLHLLNLIHAIEPHIANPVPAVEAEVAKVEGEVKQDVEKAVAPVEEAAHEIAEIPEAVQALNHME